MLNCCSLDYCCKNLIYIILLIISVVFLIVAARDVLKSHSKKAFIMCFFVSLLLFFLIYCCVCSNFGDYIAAATFLITAIGIIIAVQTLVDTKNATEAQIVDKYNTEYFDTEVFDALKVLRETYDNHPVYFMYHRKDDYNPECIFIKQFETKNLEKLMNDDEKIDKSRRVVKRYFHNANEMIQGGFISEKAFRKIIDKNGIKLFFDIVEVLEYAKNKEYNSKPFYQIMARCPDIYKKYNESLFSQIKRESEYDKTKVESNSTSFLINFSAKLSASCTSRKGK